VLLRFSNCYQELFGLKIAGYFSRGAIRIVIAIAYIYSSQAWAGNSFLFDAIVEVSDAIGKNAALPVAKSNAMSAPPVTTASVPEANTTLTVTTPAGATPGATPGVSTKGASNAPSSAADSGTTSLASKPSARTISITGAGATYKGASLPCDFCTGRTDTVATHIPTKNPADGPVTGKANLFSKHNMTPTGANTGEICAFCHTPQGAERTVSAPRWERALTTISSYRAFASMGSAVQEATGSISMACLSCHDGSQAPNIAINTPTLRLDVGDVDVNIGNTLRGHHPVGIQYGGGGQNQYAPEVIANPLAGYDRLRDMNRFAHPNRFESIYINGKFRSNRVFSTSDRDAFGDILTFSKEGLFESPNRGGFNKSTYSGTGSGTVWWVKTAGSKIGRQKTDLYLFSRLDTIDSIPDESSLYRPYVECATCHDPHSTNSTFLRMPGGNARSQICLTCHNK
jgi:predicted CXXCH cytochrome family protein